MARGLCFALGADVVPSVKAFLAINPLPASNLQLDRVDVVEAPRLDLGHLLEWMLKARQKELVIVIHGHTDGSGLGIPLSPEQADCTGTNLQLLMDLDSSGKPPTDRQLSQLGGNQK